MARVYCVLQSMALPETHEEEQECSPIGEKQGDKNSTCPTMKGA